MQNYILIHRYVDMRNIKDIPSCQFHETHSTVHATSEENALHIFEKHWEKVGIIPKVIAIAKVNYCKGLNHVR